MPEPVGVAGVVSALSVASDLTRGHPPGEAMRACLLASELARRAGLEQHEQADVYYTTLMRFAGWPRSSSRGRARTARSAQPARYAAAGYAAVMFDAVGGAELAAQRVARWSGRALDPSIVAIFLESPTELLTVSNPDDVWAAVVDAEPHPRRLFKDEALLDDTLAGFGDAADLKAPRAGRGIAGRIRAPS